MSYADKTLTCRDCGSRFVFTAQEQEFFASRGYENEPSRCQSCRAERRRGAGRFNGGSRPPAKMYSATCSACGAQTQLPFQPRADKPVYCSDCFRKQRSARR
ncbi:MAG: zinc-ribbon domain containing protein [Chloroflexi bacterium]|nr:zinc-ribbon domain containing protein [Chloroflexota bacterium]MDA8188442.1 zinc-ribbon domain containing protein [Dehalococcoidales bacterium]